MTASLTPHVGRAKPTYLPCRRWVVVAVIVLTLVTAATLFIAEARYEARVSRTRGRMSQLGLALQAYREKNGSLPPAYIADEKGTPMHSWRVLLLPYFEEDDFYRQYNFKVLWNHPDNVELAARYPQIAMRYQSGDRVRSPLETHFFAVTGSNTLWPGSISIDKGVLAQNMDKVAVVLGTENGHHWMEPHDIRIDVAPLDPSPTSDMMFLTAEGVVGQYDGRSAQYFRVIDFTHELITVRTKR